MNSISECHYKNIRPMFLIMVGVFVASAILFISVAVAAEEEQIQAAINDLESVTGQDITSEDQAKDLCNQEQYLDACADIGKKHDLYTPEEIKHVDDFLSEVKGKILDDIKSCSDEECLIKVASELAVKIKTKNPTLATNFNLTTTIIAEKQAVVQAAKEVGLNFKDCESMDPDTAPVELLRKCAKLAKDSRVQKYIPEERRALAEQFEDSATIKLREALAAGKYQCGDNTLEGCGNYCLNPDAAARAAGIPTVCTQIAKEIFGQEGVKQLESAHQQVEQVKDYYSKKFILTLPDGRELVGEGQIRNACDRAFSSRNFEVAKACGSFAVKNGFVTQGEVDKGLKLMESFTQKGQDVDFEKCISDPRACRDLIPEDDRGLFDAGNQIFEIMKAEIGFDPSQCERGAVDEAIGTKCFEGSKRALSKIESLGLANQSREAKFIIEDIKRHVSEGENLIQRKDEFRQVFNQQGGPGGCKSEAECFTYCSNSTNGPECIAFGSKQGISGFRGQEAVQKFQEYNQHLQRPGLTGDEYRPFPPEGQYFPPSGDVIYPPGQDPRFTQPGPGYSPPPGVAPYYPPFPGGPGFGGPSPECLAALQSGDFAKAKTVCYVPPQPTGFPTPPICPASPYVECPAGQYHESYRNSDGCWIDGPCQPITTYSPGPYPTYTPTPSCPSGQGWDYSLNKCSTGACDPGYHWDSATVTCKINDSTTSYTPVPSCPSGQWWEYTRNMCVSITTTYTPGPSYTGGTSCSQSLINLLGTGCHWMYSDSSGGGIYCNSEMTKSAKEGDSATTAGCSYGGGTYSPYPSPSYTPPPGGGSCPSGYHYHGESGGFCMNDQENYGGTCYDFSGTNRINCPAQPTYSPSPTYSPGPGTSSCSQSLINLLGSDCHWMYSDSSGRGIYCDGPMTKSAKEGDATTMAGCSSGGSTYSPYPTYSPSPGTSYSPYPTSTSTYTPYPTYSPSPGTSYSPYPTSTSTYTPYPTSTYTYTPYPSCPSGQWWDSATSSCHSSTSSYSPYPTSTYTYTPYPTYESTYTPPPSTYSPPPTETYTPPPYSPPPAESYSPPPTSNLYPQYMVAHCQQLGRTWNGKICQANGLFARFYEGSGMANALRLFYIIP